MPQSLAVRQGRDLRGVEGAELVEHAAFVVLSAESSARSHVEPPAEQVRGAKLFFAFVRVAPLLLATGSVIRLHGQVSPVSGVNHVARRDKRAISVFLADSRFNHANR